MTCYNDLVRENEVTSRRRVDAREVSNTLRRAGFTGARSTGTRIRGAPHVTAGFTARKFNPLGTKDWVVDVTWESSSNYMGNERLLGTDRDPVNMTLAMAAALEAAGYTVERPWGERSTTLWTWRTA